MAPSVPAATIVIKLGTSSILSEHNLHPRLGVLASLAETVVALRASGHRVILVSSGAIGMGIRRMSLLERAAVPSQGLFKKPKSLHEKQALAAIGQSHLIALWDSLFSPLNQPISQILITRGDLADRFRYLNASSTINTLLSLGVVPIINENDTLSVAEIRFGDNDTLSAVTAGMCKADYLFLMTDVDCLFTENPRHNPQAKMVSVVFDIEGLRKMVSTVTLGSSLGTGGMETKLIAAELAIAAGVSTIICNASKPERLLEIMSDLQAFPATSHLSPINQPALLVAPSLTDSPSSPSSRPLYTRFVPQREPLSDRKFWVAHGLIPRGAVVIDDGAHRAISHESNGGRLLAAGLVSVLGHFAVGQAVTILINASYPGQSINSAQPKTSSGRIDTSLLPPRPANTQSEPPLAPYKHLPHLPDGCVEVGRGLANYNSSEMSQVVGFHSSQVEKQLGHIDSEHVVESIILSKPHVWASTHTSGSL